MPNNYYRLLRVLEIVQTTGKTMSELDIDEQAPLDYDFRCFFLHRPRMDLYRRIDFRCEEMIKRGLLQVESPCPRTFDFKRNFMSYPVLCMSYRKQRSSCLIGVYYKTHAQRPGL